MRKNGNIDLEVADFFPVEADQHLLSEESAGEDALTKFLSDWKYGIDSEELASSLAHVHQRIDSHYTKLAQDAEAATPKVTAPADTTILQKRWNVDPKAGYRQYFRDRLAKGISAESTLQSWLEQFPHANPDCTALMVEVSKEFS